MASQRGSKKNFLNYIKQIAAQYSLTDEKVSEFLKDSFTNNYLKEYPDNSIGIVIDLKNGLIKMWKNLLVVPSEYYYGEGQEDDETLITAELAKSIKGYEKKEVKLNSYVKKKIDINEFDTKLVKNILYYFQKLTLEEMNRRVYEQWQQYKGQVLEGLVEKVIENKDQSPKEIYVSLIAPNGKTTKGVINRFDLVKIEEPNGIKVYEKLAPGNTYYFYVKDVLESSNECPILLSRVDSEIVKFLMKKNISEIADGSIEIRQIARLPGVKTKVLVSSKHKNLDPIGCCIGPKGKRLKYISAQLLNEKIDVILWSDDPVKNVINSFVPASIIGYRVDGDLEITLIATLDNLLSAIGKKGINSKLVYMLTGWKTNLKTIQEAKDEKIEYTAYDGYGGANASNLSNRIYEIHFQKNDAILNELDAIRKSSNKEKNKIPVDVPQK